MFKNKSASAFLFVYHQKTRRNYMLKLHITLFLILFAPMSFAENIHFKTQAIQNSKNPFTGNIPYIQGKGFTQINQQIKKELLADDGTRIDFSSEKLYQDKNYLTTHTHLEIEGGRSYVREKYYVIDLKTKKILTLNQILKRYKLSAQDISKQIAQQIAPCVEGKLTVSSEECEDATMQYLYQYYAEDQNFIDLKNADGFYLKKDILGISFDAGVYSVPFEYSLKTHSIK